MNLPRPDQKSAPHERPATTRKPGAPSEKLKPKKLVLVAWSPAQLSQAAPGQQDVRQYFCNLNRHLRLQIQDFGWWRPTENQLAQLAFAVQTLDQPGISALLCKFIDACEPVVPNTQKKPASKPASASSAVRPGQRSVLNPLAAEQHAAQWREQLDREIFAPLLRAIESCSCPFVKNLRYAHLTASVALHNYLERVVATYDPANKTLDSEQTKLITFSHLQMLMDTCLKLTREIRAAEQADEVHQRTGTCSRVAGAKHRQCQPPGRGSSSG